MDLLLYICTGETLLNKVKICRLYILTIKIECINEVKKYTIGATLTKM